jgi:methylthioxylose transferase
MNRIPVRLRTTHVTQAVTRSPGSTRAHVGPRASSSATWWPLALWFGVIAAARVVLLDLQDSGAALRIPFAPLDAVLDWRPGWPLVLPAALGLAVVVGAPSFLARARWSSVLVVSATTAAGWAVALALLDGARGIVGSVTLKNEYFLDVTRVGDPLVFLRGFTSHIAEYRVHVQGHPPGFLLLLWVLDRVGLGVPAVVAGLEIAVGCLAVPAVLVTVREVAGEATARRAAPFVAVAPLAIWVASSADACYAGVGAAAVMLVVLATGERGRRADVLAALGGLVFGAVAFLSYGLVLLAVVPIAIAAHRRRARVLAVAAGGAASVVLAFALAGFCWLAGLAATRARYTAGVAARRPYAPFLLANCACLGIALGPALAVALARLRDRRLWWVVGAALGAVGIAALSGLSKGEVERIWLPFALWILPAGAVLSVARRPSRWLAIQVAFTIVLQTLVRSPW